MVNQEVKKMDNVVHESYDSWKKSKTRAIEDEKYMDIYLDLGKNVRPEPGQNFLVVVFLFQNPPVEGNHGSIFPVGTYSTIQDAERKVTELITKFKVDLCRIYQLATWNKLLEKTPAKYVKYINDKSEIISLQDLHQQQKMDSHKRETELREKIEEEHFKSNQPCTVEHYTYAWYRTIKHKSKLEFLNKQIADTEKLYQADVEKIQSDFKSNPELDKNWLKELEPKLKERDEQGLYEAIASSYHILKSEILDKQ
jgi:hypothetical protein